MSKFSILFLIFFIGPLTVMSQNNLEDLINALPQMEKGIYKGTFINDSLVKVYLDEYVYEAKIRGINIAPYLEDINWILIEPQTSNGGLQLERMNLGKIDKEHKLILLSRNCLLDRLILKSTLFREVSHYLGLPYKEVDYGIMSLNKFKGYSYSWLDDYEISRIQFDDLFMELKKILSK